MPTLRLDCSFLGLPPRSPNLNAYVEWFVRSIKDECLNRMIFFGERSPRRATREFAAHYHWERTRSARDRQKLTTYTLSDPKRRLFDLAADEEGGSQRLGYVNSQLENKVAKVTLPDGRVVKKAKDVHISPGWTAWRVQSH